MPNTFDEACRVVLRDPDGSHSLYTTLAPLFNRMMAGDSEHYEAQYDRLRKYALGARSVLEFGCGTGRLLALLEANGAFDRLVGVGVHAEVLEFAADRVARAELVRADATDCSVGTSFDAVCAFEYVAAHMRTDAELRAFLDTAYAHCRPGGVFVFDAVSEPGAVREESIGIYRSPGYRLERAVDVIPVPDGSVFDLRVDYRVTDRETGEQAVVSERTPIRTIGVDDLRERLAAAGFADVDIGPTAGEAGAIVAVARRPEPNRYKPV
jgi:SAM-dependent methyltransferase